jgi:hypothetical protein
VLEGVDAESACDAGTEVVAELGLEPSGSKPVGETELAEADPGIDPIVVGLGAAEVLLLWVDVGLSLLTPKPRDRQE